ncbi:hypothetical protein AQV86_01700 [Nanohaloarchaea archaeon SG9]|nr:hypothetical protein AQV86_01700 [Nanohaloarchaea archaeon SG9]
MDPRKAQKFERHRKELRKKAFLNITIVILVATGLAFYIGGFTADFLYIFLSTNIAVWFSTVFVAALIFIWSLPLLHYREEAKMKSEKAKEHFLDMEPEKSPIVQVMEERGWEKIESDENEVRLETYPTLFHRILKKKASLHLEEEERGQDHEVTVLKTGGKEVSRIKTEYEETDEGLEITETTVSRTRVSPIYVEVTLYLMPEIEELTEEAANEEIEIIDEDIDYSINHYEFE